MEEQWKDIENYEGYYQVSNIGNVRSVDRVVIQKNNGTLTKTLYKGKNINKAKRGNYLVVHLSIKNKQKWELVHRLVAKAFIPQEEGKNIVNHLDNNPSNNCVDNLEWTTYKGNMQYSTKQGRMKYNPNNLKKAQESRKKPVIAIKNGNQLYFESMADAKKHGFNAWHIAECCNNKLGYKTHKGYEWRWA